MSVTTTMLITLCASCQHCREIVSGKGSRFFFCQLSHTDARFPKYPPQPLHRCIGYDPRTKSSEPRTDEPA